MATDPLRPIRSSTWNEAKARHLLNRAGFGVDRARLEAMLDVGAEKSVDALVNYEWAERIPSDPNFIPRPEYFEEFYANQRKISEEARREARNDLRREERARIRALQAWWLERMTATQRPLEEKMTLFWHGHFAVSAQKVQKSLDNYHLNRVFREYATGNFQQLTMEVAQSPAMLRYLDNNRNVKGKPNENWARELMELFTMGPGNYTENDIKESARAFTGWTINSKGFRFDARKHDNGYKQFFGRRGQWGGQDIIRIIFEQPATAEFIAGKLVRFFVTDEPDYRMIHALAGSFRGNRYELKPVLTQLFLSEGFYRPDVMGAQIKSPAQFVVQLAHDVGLEKPPYDSMARASAALGQNLFYPPNVKGWDGGRAWINANTLLTRYNLPKDIVAAPPTTASDMMVSGMGMMNDNRSREAMARERMQEVMEEMPERERNDLRRKLRDAKSRDERNRLVSRELRKHGGLSGWDIEDVFASLQFDTAGECANALANHFLSKPLSGEQADIIARALGRQSKDSALKPADLNRERMNAALHLLLSSAEYQLC